MLKPIADFLQSALNRTGAERVVSAAVVVENAEPLMRQILSDLHPADIRVISYKLGTLTIGAANPTVGQEVKMRSEALLEALRSTFPNQGIVRIRVRPMAREDSWSKRY
ncbi:MAG: DciA family protein [Patescibacteria group bacterium]|jgi:hypothetical protein